MAKNVVVSQSLKSLVWTHTGHPNVSQINKVIWPHHYIDPKYESKVFQHCKHLPKPTLKGEIPVWIEWGALRSTDGICAGKEGTDGYMQCIGIY
jgi:hypothetical protein